MEGDDGLCNMVRVRLRAAIIPFFSFMYVRVDDKVRDVNAFRPELARKDLG